MTRVVALTGSVAAGKSTVAALFGAWGAEVIDADAIVRALQQPGTAVFDAIVERFGKAILLRDGALDRGALRQRILDDGAARRDLEAIVHPAVESGRRERVASARARGVPIVVADIPLLFEAADPSAYDGVIVVDAPESLRRQRLMARRGLSARDADRLMAAQWPAARKRALADWVIDNDKDLETLAERARDVWQALSR